MKLFEGLKNYLEYTDGEIYEDYDNDPYYDYGDDMVYDKVQTVMRGDPIPDFEYNREQISEEERKHCIKLYEMASAFNKLDAATVMCVLCQNHMDVVMSAVMNEISEMRETLDKYKEVGK